MSKTVAVIGALDTKGKENEYLVKKLKDKGLEVIFIDLAVMGNSYFTADYPNNVVAEEGGVALEVLKEKKDRELGLNVMSNGALRIVKKLIAEKRIDGICAMGGGQGTFMAGNVLRNLPVGFPKALASTVAFTGLNNESYIGMGDTYMANSIVDIEGLNIVLRETICRLAAVIDALVHVEVDEGEKVKGTVALSMWGITTPCVDKVTHILEENGYEVMVFHATGDGGNTMEELTEQGKVDLVIDVTPAELSHEVLDVGCGWKNHRRMTVAGACGVPQIIVPGGLDALNLPSVTDTDPRWEGRKFHMHNATLKAVRTTGEDLKKVGEVLCERLNASKGKVEVFLPMKGFSANDIEGGDFYEPEADAEFIKTVHAELREDFPIHECENNINDPVFAAAIAARALELLKG